MENELKYDELIDDFLKSKKIYRSDLKLLIHRKLMDYAFAYKKMQWNNIIPTTILDREEIASFLCGYLTQQQEELFLSNILLALNKVPIIYLK